MNNCWIYFFRLMSFGMIGAACFCIMWEIFRDYKKGHQ